MDISHPTTKKTAIRKILEVTFCAACHEIPEIEVSYAEPDVTRIEHWCRSCYQLSLEREREESQTRSREELAAFYSCTIAEDGHFGGPKR